MEEKIKVKVLKPFINKYSKEAMEEGQILEITQNRLNEIEKVSLEFVQVISKDESTEDTRENKDEEEQE
ncbi:hypothetical protein ACP49_16220 [Clostridium botulinum]|uniref:hypothetical protein n=1 Tax=Clostridium botulinum TaxID=1491 RepID=UPI0005F8CF75|nr:hypothetical protein [Clostridium botulinum]KOM97078.1 hypothetical protein ACP53_11395 [Clostridium botulinum]KOM99495.1 hypothetical protein ACP49_16220 [Clostridium botulinum]MBY7004551.1 hypothetical protein [Clostridium botulinum]MCR1147216.1 hypothetical protein [Clostridium botulinum]NFH94513.1 hypothetical protein [Clostridium botulinum]